MRYEVNPFQMSKPIFSKTTFPILFVIAIVLVLFAFSQRDSFQGPAESIEVSLVNFEHKQKGAHIFGIEDTTCFQEIRANNIEWISMVSWGFQEDYQSQIMSHHNGDSAYMLKYDSAWVKRIQTVHAGGFKVFLKPHIWVDAPSTGKWRSDIFPANDENWILWKESYRNFILRYAQIAEKANVEMFCVGMELTRLSLEKPDYWRNLIAEVRGVYSGKLTYAANWYKEYEEIVFWDELDYIGIQAYFPLVENENPSVEQISKGWEKHLRDIESIHEEYNKPILFTEMGYKSTSTGAIKPWEWIEESADVDRLLSFETQANCYEAFFNSVWNKEWFSGVHLWQMRGDHSDEYLKDNMDFTPQNKPAQEIIAKGFK